MTAGAARAVPAAVAAAAFAVAFAVPAAPGPETPASADPRRSGLADMSPSLQRMQQDEKSNPGMLWVKDGEALWSRPAGAANRSCASCHGDAGTSMRGVAARYPAYDDSTSAPLALAGRINACRVRHQGAAHLDRDDESALALEAWVAYQSRGEPVAPPLDPRLEPYRGRGERTYRERIGQLALACADCHDAHAGRRLGGSVIPQGHPTGYPIYRLEWQGMGSLARRLRGCMTGVRAEPLAGDAEALVELELYLMRRAAGMAVETPAVRP